MKKALCLLLTTGVVVALISLLAFNPPKAEAVPSFARQTGLACTGCHYTPPELNPAGRRFKLTGYVDRGDDTKTIKADGGKNRSALDILGSLPLSIMFETSFTSTKSPIPTTQNGSFELPQDISLFLSGAWTSNVGSFVQATYDTQDDHFTSDNTDIRFAKITKLRGKDFVWGIDLNNNPTVEDLWNSTPAWGYPWMSSDWAPTPSAGALINGGLAEDVAGVGVFGMWDNHLYVDLAAYRSEHVGGPQPNPGVGAGINIRGFSPYWRVAWQQLTGRTQYEIGTYGLHMRTTPNGITQGDGTSFPWQDSYTDWAIDTQIDRSLFKRDVLSFRATYIRENNSLIATFQQEGAAQVSHHLNTVQANAEYHFGNKYSATGGFFDITGTPDGGLFAAGPISGSANGDPRGAGYILNFSYWPWQNMQLGAQYTGYTRFNGGSTNYDGSGRNANSNNTAYIDLRFFF